MPGRKVVRTMGEPALAPGWYPDPWQQGELRWHDGSEWTGHLHGGAAAAAAATEPEPEAEPAVLAAVPDVFVAQPVDQVDAATAATEHRLEARLDDPGDEALAVFAQQAPEPASPAMPSMEETLLAPHADRGNGVDRTRILLAVMAVLAIGAIAFVLLGRGGEAPAVTPAPGDAAPVEPVAVESPAALEPPAAEGATDLATAADLAGGATPAATPAAPGAAPAARPTGERIPELETTPAPPAG